MKKEPDAPGIYDNHHTMCREVWHEIDGRMVLVQATSIAAMYARSEKVLSKWGTYPRIDQ